MANRTFDISKLDTFNGSDTDPSRGDMAAMTLRHPPKGKGLRKGKSEQAAARAEATRDQRDRHQSRALSYF